MVSSSVSECHNCELTNKKSGDAEDERDDEPPGDEQRGGIDDGGDDGGDDGDLSSHAQRQNHGEEEDGPKGRHRHLRDGFRVDDESQTEALFSNGG